MSHGLGCLLFIVKQSFGKRSSREEYNMNNDLDKFPGRNHSTAKSEKNDSALDNILVFSFY